MKSIASKIVHVAVVESDPVRFVGLSTVLSGESDMRIRAADLASVLHGRQDELVLLATDRGPAFASTMSSLKAVRPGIRVIVIGSGRADDDILRAVSAGAKGYVAEEASSDELKRAIREVHKGSVWLPRQVMATFIERATALAHPAQGRADAKISEREREVLRLLVSGCSNREIAEELGIIERTVKAHVAQLLRKTGVPNRTALTVHAVTRSLLSAV